MTSPLHTRRKPSEARCSQLRYAWWDSRPAQSKAHSTPSSTWIAIMSARWANCPIPAPLVERFNLYPCIGVTRTGREGRRASCLSLSLSLPSWLLWTLDWLCLRSSSLPGADSRGVNVMRSPLHVCKVSSFSKLFIFNFLSWPQRLFPLWLHGVMFAGAG